MSNTLSARVQRCRYALKKMDCLLHKSRARKLSLEDHGGYQIVDIRKNWAIAGLYYDLSLEEVEEFIECNK